MTGAEAAAALFGGLGLFFIGIRELSVHLQQLAGPRMRALMARAAGGPLRAAATGTAIGVVTQSSNAATFVTTSLLTAGLLPLGAALTAVAWSNVGPAVFVTLTTIDVRLGALWLIGVIGFANLLGAGSMPRLKPLLAAALSVAFALLGLAIVKSAGAVLDGIDPGLLTEGVLGRARVMPFLVGLVVAVVVQSSSTPTILAIKLAEAGLLEFDQLALGVYGASLGSGLGLLVAGRGLTGTARQVVLFQALFKSLGALLFLLLFAIERWGGVPLVLRLSDMLGHDRAGSIAVLFLLVQLGGCAALLPFGRALAGLVARWSPATRAEEMGRPRFLFRRAVDDPLSALDLVVRENERLQARLPSLLDPVRDGAPPGGPSRDAVMAGSAALEAEIARFLSGLLGRGAVPEAVARAVQLESRLDDLRTLRETLSGFGDVLLEVRDPGVHQVTRPLAESLHFLLQQVCDAAGPEDLALVQDLSADRGEMMEALRRQATAAGSGLAYAAQDQLFRATTLFERAVWLVRRLAVRGS